VRACVRACARAGVCVCERARETIVANLHNPLLIIISTNSNYICRPVSLIVKGYILPRRCIYVFRMVLIINFTSPLNVINGMIFVSEERLCSLEVRVPGYRTEMYCFL
jgi:hypothetical protein